MKIGIYIGHIQDKEAGGSATFQNDIINHFISFQSKFNNKNFDFHILYQAKKDLPFATSDKIKFARLKKSKNIFCKKKINEKILDLTAKKLEIDLIWYLIPAYFETNTPYIFTLWDLAHRLFPYLPEITSNNDNFEKREKFYCEAIAKASYVIIGNQAGAEQIERFYNFDKKRIRTIPFCTDIKSQAKLINNNDGAAFLAKHNLKKDQYLFYPAQFWAHKNHITILNAVEKLKKENQEITVVFCGSDKGNLEYIKQQVQEKNIADNIKFLGFISKEELVVLYQNALSLVFSSILGPDNLPPIEALSLSCPVICANYDGAKDQLQDCALYFNPLNHGELVAIIKDLKNGIYNKRESLKNKDELLEEYSPENYIKKIFEIFEEFQATRGLWKS